MNENKFEKTEEDEFDQEVLRELGSLLLNGKEKEYLSKLDEFLAKVKTEDCGERMLSLEEVLPPSIFINLVDLKINTENLDRLQLRDGVVKKLINAQNSLPTGLHLVVRDAFRSKSVVEKLYERYVGMLMEKEKISKEEADIKVRSLLAMPDDIVPPGHMTGGAVDVILAYDDGTFVPMEVEDSIIPRQKQTWTDCPELPQEIKDNRQILLKVMKEAGFHNYSKEYWHYSYGDAYWAVRRKNKIAIYGIPS